MKLISDKSQLLKNIETVETYLVYGTENEQLDIQNCIKRGTCFVAYKIESEIRFAPSKFLGYRNNSLNRHIPSQTDGRDTNKVINIVLNSKPLPNDNLEKKYFKYSNNLGIYPSENGAYGVKRKFWQLDITKDFKTNEEFTGEFPEGKIVEQVHKSRERNSKLIMIAKQNFISKYGKLFCQVCNFNFENSYGSIGKDFIEGHHTIAVSDMTHGHQTKPEDIAMLCSNCHRMIHKRRPWLSMNDLKKLIRKNADS
jgi:predicted HNH restriction endonuclease